MKKKILFRADGSSEIGMGHIYRCISIAERVNKNFDCFFAIREPSQVLINLISTSSTVIPLRKFENYLIEAEEIAVNIIPQYEIDITTLDGYYFNTAYQQIIKEKCKSVLVSIDDDQPFHYVSDIVINHAGGVKPEQISKESYTKLFLGYDYLLLRKEFMQAAKKEKYISGITSVLICFGGADPNDFTGRFFDCLKNKKNIHKIIVVIGASYTKAKELKNSSVDSKHVEIMSNVNSETLAEIMYNTDLAIVPSSTISLEALASKMILITGMTADNQRFMYNDLIKEDTVIGVDNFMGLTCTELLRNINMLSQKFKNYTCRQNFNNSDSVLSVFKSISC